MISESESIQRMLAGDERAFQAFFEAYFPRLYRFALPRLGRDIEATREVVQATLAKAMRKLASFRGDAALFTWICQICSREIIDYRRVHQRHARHVVLAEDSAELHDAMEMIAAPEHATPIAQYSQDETRRLVRVILDRLPQRYGDVLEWKYVEGQSVEEIGLKLGVGPTAAQSLLARARVAFREALETVFGAAAADVLSGLGVSGLGV